MPNNSEISNRISHYKNAGQDIVRREILAELAAYTKRDTIVYATKSGQVNSNIPAHTLSVTTEDIKFFMSAVHGLQNDNLDLILHSPGGSLEAAEQIVNYLRSKYMNSPNNPHKLLPLTGRFPESFLRLPG